MATAETRLLVPADDHATAEVTVAKSRLASAPDEGLLYFEPQPLLSLRIARDLWQHRELIASFALRDLKVRYRQTVVGVAWVVLQPLAMMAVFATIFGLLGKQPASDSVPYALVALSGLLPWQLFAVIVQQASSSLVAHQSMISKVYFPRLVLPIAASLPPLVDFLIGMAVLLPLCAVWGIWPTWSLLALPLLMLGLTLTALSLGIGLSALNAQYRDIGYVVPFMLQLGFFVCPVIYETSALIPASWQPWFALNPLAALIEGVRWSVVGAPPPAGLVVLSAAAIMVALLLAGVAYFRHTERFLADRI
jgi:lipopolysaccharide transport system permease protein